MYGYGYPMYGGYGCGGFGGEWIWIVIVVFILLFIVCGNNRFGCGCHEHHNCR